jgi:phage repressor protein C with HTH and peptisase S24 domain
MSDDQNAAIGSRLAVAVKAAGGNAAIAKASGVSTRTLSRYIAGTHEMPLLTASRLASACGIGLEWLLNGENSDGYVASVNSDLSQVNQKAGETLLLPLLNVVGAAGNGIENHDVEVIDRLPFSRQLLRRLGVPHDRAQFIQHRGDSMMPTLTDGGICLIDTSRDRPRGDGVYALVVGNELLIKRLAIGAKGLTLISDNADKYPPETLTGDELGRVRVIGKVFWTGGEV